jgi:hypothetical protein
VDSGCIDLSLFQEEFEDTKVVIRIRKSKKDRQDNGKRKVQTMIYKTHPESTVNFKCKYVHSTYANIYKIGVKR